MFLGLAGLLIIIWCVLFFAKIVTGGLIHILLVLAVISFIVHLFSGRKS